MGGFGRGGFGGPGGPDQRSADLEMKLDRILREVEALKREIHGAAPQAQPAPSRNRGRTTPPADDAKPRGGETRES